MKTKDEIMQLSGRDLDAAVAEALGWDDISINPSTGHLNGTHRLQSTIIRELVPRYSTDIAAAWELVEKMMLKQRKSSSPKPSAARSCWQWRAVNLNLSVD